MRNDKNHCRVCGYLLEDPPWGDTGTNPSFEICPCCGVEFGYEDCTLDAIRAYRKKWLDAGAEWFDADERPDNWNVEAQIGLIPVRYK